MTILLTAFEHLDCPLATLVPPTVALAWARRSQHPWCWEGGLHAEEAEFVGRAVPRRQQEFAAGRNCARHALRNLGLPADLAEVPIGVGLHREPLFPSGVIGSITHCDDFCAAAVTRVGGTLVSIGIDVEVNQQLDSDIAALIMRAQERHTWESTMQPSGHPATFAFSIKEAFFKAAFPRCHRYLDFGDAWLSPAASDGDGHFSIAPTDPRLTACLEGLRIVGHCAADAGHVYSVVTLHR